MLWKKPQCTLPVARASSRPRQAAPGGTQHR